MAPLALMVVALLGASSASAARFVSEAQLTEYVSQESSTQSFRFGSGSATYECGPIYFADSRVGSATPGGEFSVNKIGSSEFSSGSCSGLTMNWNGCKPRFYAPKEGTTKGTIEIGPAGCGPVLVSDSIHKCNWTIPAQSGIPVTYTNTGSGTGRAITAEVNTSSLQHTSAGGASCGHGGQAGSFSDGSWSGQWGIVGESVTGSPVGIRVADLPAGLGFYVAGSEPLFQAEEYPGELVGDVSKEHRFKTKSTNSTSLVCPTGDLTATLAGASSTVNVDVAYDPCQKLLNQTPIVKMNSCHYALSVANAGPPYTGTASIACDQLGDKIVIEVGTLCSYWLPPQQFGTVSYQNLGEGTSRHVVAEVEGTTLSSTRIGSTLCPAASESGTFSGGFLLEGLG